MIPNKFNPLGQRSEALPPDNEVWYYAPAQVTLYDSTGVTGHTFCDGKGVLTFASAVTSVGTWLRATAITDAKLPDTVTTINQNAFTSCTSLVYIHLPDAVTTIGVSAFNGCQNLALTRLPDALINVLNYAFYNCKKLAVTSMPSTLQKLFPYALANCTGLTSLTFHATPTSITATSFDGCANLADIYVPWAEGTVANAPWGATNATIHYNS